jgi:hypothetical protein
MMEHLSQLHPVFERTGNSIAAFMNMLSPTIAQAENGYERLYFHHIYEEEEQHLERLNQLIPKLSRFLDSGQSIDTANQELVSLLQDINLEKFGLHNFLEHLDLVMYHFKDEERNQMLTSMSEQTKADYLLAKDVLSRMNESSLPSHNPASIKESEHHNVTTAAHDDTRGDNPLPASSTGTTLSPTFLPTRKGLSVGSLKSVR